MCARVSWEGLRGKVKELPWGFYRKLWFQFRVHTYDNGGLPSCSAKAQGSFHSGQVCVWWYGAKGGVLCWLLGGVCLRCSDGVLVACCVPVAAHQARLHAVTALLSKHEHSLSAEEMQGIARFGQRPEGLVPWTHVWNRMY